MDNYYRYVDLLVGSWDPWREENTPGSSHILIQERKYSVLKRTHRGVWIGYIYDKRWIGDTSRKKFAYPTREAAWKSFKHRKRRQLKIYASRARQAKMVLDLAMGPVPKVFPVSLDNKIRTMTQKEILDHVDDSDLNDAYVAYLGQSIVK